MAVYDALTGLRRKLPKRNLNWKIRETHSSTVAARMHGRNAIKAYKTYLRAAQQCLLYSAAIMTANSNSTALTSILSFLMISGGVFYMKARRMLQLESDLLDIPALLEQELEETERFHKELTDIDLDSFHDDNECAVKTRFSKAELLEIIEALDLPDELKIYYHPRQYYKFRTITLLICVLRRWSTGRTFQDLHNEFGGCPSRWARGYYWLIDFIDTRYYGIIGPEGLRKWAPHFPFFAEHLREYIQRDKHRINPHDGREYVLTTDKRYNPGDFNVFSFTDCSVYESCRPGSGPTYPYPLLEDDGPTDRRGGWYIKQRAFYDGFHRGMEACIKILTICLPNGLT